MARDYRKITAFQKADDLACQIYKITQGWPKEERFGLISQLRRAAVSAAANIVEGASRSGDAEYLHFLSIARGSLREAGYLFHLGMRLGYVREHIFDEIYVQFEEANKVLWGLTRSIAESVRSGKAPDRVREDDADYILLGYNEDTY